MARAIHAVCGRLSSATYADAPVGPLDPTHFYISALSIQYRLGLFLLQEAQLSQTCRAMLCVSECFTHSRSLSSWFKWHPYV